MSRVSSFGAIALLSMLILGVTMARAQTDTDPATPGIQQDDNNDVDNDGIPNSQDPDYTGTETDRPDMDADTDTDTDVNVRNEMNMDGDNQDDADNDGVPNSQDPDYTGSLPDTAGPWPLVALLGAGSLAIAWGVRRAQRSRNRL